MRLFTLFLIGCVSVQAAGAVINVPADQATIQAAINIAVNGDEIIVAPGKRFDPDLIWRLVGEEKVNSIAIVGDAEMDEGNMYEALLEGRKHDLRNCWWIIDYNRQSLDGVVSDRLFRWIDRIFRTTGWTVVTLKYGKRMMEAFAKPGGKTLKKWINDCPTICIRR